MLGAISIGGIGVARGTHASGTSAAANSQYDPITCVNTQRTRADIERCQQAIVAARNAHDRTLADHFAAPSIAPDHAMGVHYGIHDVLSGDNLGIAGDYQLINMWVGDYQSKLAQVIAGCAGTQGVVLVRSLDPTSHVSTSESIYPAPAGAGCLSVRTADVSRGLWE